MEPALNSGIMKVFPSTSRTPPKDAHVPEEILYPSYWLLSVLYLTDPVVGAPRCNVVPDGNAKEVTESTITLLPSGTLKVKEEELCTVLSKIDMDVLLFKFCTTNGAFFTKIFDILSKEISPYVFLDHVNSAAIARESTVNKISSISSWPPTLVPRIKIVSETEYPEPIDVIFILIKEPSCPIVIVKLAPFPDPFVVPVTLYTPPVLFPETGEALTEPNAPVGGLFDTKEPSVCTGKLESVAPAIVTWYTLSL